MLCQLIFLSVCIVACSAEFYDVPKDNYTPEQLRHDGEELRKRIECLMDRGPCTHITAAYRKYAEDMVLTACIKCSPELKSLAQAFLSGVKEKYPAAYKELILKYDKYGSAVGVIRTILSSLLSSPPGTSMQSIHSTPPAPPLPPIFIFFFSCNIICDHGTSNCVSAQITNCSWKK